MRDVMYDELALERAVKAKFGIDVDLRNVILLKAPVSRTAVATLFLTANKQLYLYIDAQSKLVYSDIAKIVNRMGLKAESYAPPKGRPDYFNEVARGKFKEVFPGRKHIDDNDLRFYRTLVPYNPALVLINEVKDGHVYQFDSDSANNWRLAVKFAYRRIKMS